MLSSNILVMGFSSRQLPLRWGAIASRHRRTASSLRVSLKGRLFSPLTSSSTKALSTKTTISPKPPKSSLLSLYSSATSTVEDRKEDANKEYEEQYPTDDTIFALSSGFTGEQATAVAVSNFIANSYEEVNILLLHVL